MMVMIMMMMICWLWWSYCHDDLSTIMMWRWYDDGNDASMIMILILVMMLQWWWLWSDDNAYDFIMTSYQAIYFLTIHGQFLYTVKSSFFFYISCYSYHYSPFIFNIYRDDKKAWAGTALLSLYAENRDKFLSSAYKQNTVCQLIGNQMAFNGYDCDGRQCNEQFRALKHRYILINCIWMLPLNSIWTKPVNLGGIYLSKVMLRMSLFQCR